MVTVYTEIHICRRIFTFWCRF